MSLYTVYPPQKDAPAPVHARAYETAQQILCHGSCCERILSLVRAMFQQLKSRPPRFWPDELCRPPKHPWLQAVCHPPRYYDGVSRASSAVRPKRSPLKNRPKSTPAHDSVAAAVSHKHHSIIRVGAGLIQFVHARTCSLAADVSSNKFLFRPFFPASFNICRYMHIYV